MSDQRDPFVEQHAGLCTVHHALLGSLHAALAATSLEVLVPQARAAGAFLVGHHHAEDTALFPGLRRRGRLRSSDVTFLDACDRAHRELHALSERLLACASASHPDAAEIALAARETRALLSLHVAEEEAGLTPERLREMIDEGGLLEIGRELEALRARR